jgi:hypothetical protein
MENNWPGWWSKMEIFRPDIAGDFLYFDLDTVIVGDLSDIARIRQLTMLTDFFVPSYLASGVMYLPWFERGDVWKKWIKGPEAHMRTQLGHGDGGFLRDHWKDRPTRWQDELPGQIISYKAHVRKPQHPTMEKGNGAIPDNARVVCFHGTPRPRNVRWLGA